jgi:staphylococcal nuclease domain-containing protein 1
MVGKANLAEGLLENGYAEVVRHRAEEERSVFYEKLLAAEERAMARKKGMHSDAKQSSRQIVDLTERARGKKGEELDAKQRQMTAKAKSFLPFLTRKSQLDAVVEYCFSATRLKCTVPGENCIINFVLSGVRTPATRQPRPREDGEPVIEVDIEKNQQYNAIALEYVKQKCLQHDVRIEVEDMDKGDNFIGTLFVKGENINHSLVSQGLASVFRSSAEKSKHGEQLFAAQRQARDQKLNMWENFVERKRDEKAEEEEEDFEVKNELLRVTLTEITSAAQFYCSIANDANAAKVEATLKEFTEAEQEPVDPDWKPNKGQVCAGLYSHDNEWHRIRVDTATSTGKYRVLFMDYGNADVLELAHIRPIPDSLAKLAPIAKGCLLAGVKQPADSSDYFDDAAHAFSDYTAEKELLAKVEYRDNSGKLHLTLWTDEKDLSINQKMVRDGWVRIPHRPERKLINYCKALKEHEDFAKQARAPHSIWEYGDVSDEDEDDDRFGNNLPRKKKAGQA